MDSYPFKLHLEHVSHTVLIEVTRTEHEDESITLRTQLGGTEYCCHGSCTEYALLDLAKSLPQGYKVCSCLTCQHGNFCPTGDNDNEIFCVSDFRPQTKSDLYHVTEDPQERRKRSRTLFHWCADYKPQTDNYFTYK